MLIPCPCCGPRAMAEFSYGGAALRRPAPEVAQDAAANEAWDEFVYLRDNPKGAHRELWFHAAGCRMWFTLRRDTGTNAVLHEVMP